ncbi:GGDEF domain-containing protein [Cellulomonas aerilata]|uniref:Histidine kinase n=1 Tax=Cellulomonas aerilata TaxID=515326 RepID=A0A512D870_9CELL|nr:sensor domain-containing diguanylate cyclase [Cellulomonas aerilata]GEO32684.1 histidine kinase [Cellulomonas aerilata]
MDDGSTARPARDVLPFADFAAAAREVTRELRARLGMRAWMVTRAAGEHQVVLQVDDAPDGYGIDAGAVLSWDGSLCAEMVAGHGPHVAPRVADVPAFAHAPNRRHAPVEAYIGVPLVQSDGRVFGTLCAFDPEPQAQSLHDAEGLVVVQARLLSTVLELELANQELHRRAERAEADATMDALTQTGNRRGWDHTLAAEEARCRRYGHPACVLVIDVNGLKEVNDSRGHTAGDRLLAACAAALTDNVRTSDYVARLGGDEFAVLTVETDRHAGTVERERLHAALRAAGVDAAVGLGVRHPESSLQTAWRQADEAMYRDKRQARGSAAHHGR